MYDQLAKRPGRWTIGFTIYVALMTGGFVALDHHFDELGPADDWFHEVNGDYTDAVVYVLACLVASWVFIVGRFAAFVFCRFVWYEE